jgi:hypothetical protein
VKFILADADPGADARQIDVVEPLGATLEGPRHDFLDVLLVWKRARRALKGLGLLPSVQFTHRGEMMKVHGHKRRTGMTTEYRIWLSIKRRCSDKKCKDYKNYGKRGIKVCERWDKSFVDFLADMGRRPRGCSIGRLDSRGNYEPGNCKWITPVEIAEKQRRTSIEIEVDGLKFSSLTAACRHFGVPRSRVFFRMNAGIPMEHWFKDEWLPRRRDRLSFLPKNHPDRLAVRDQSRGQPSPPEPA